jgi:hypothetical protein
MRSLMICTPHQYCWGEQIEKNDMGGACSTYGGEERCTQGFFFGGGRNLRERDHLEDPVLDGRMVLRWIFRKWDVRVWTASMWLRIRTGGGHL